MTRAVRPPRADPRPPWPSRLPPPRPRGAAARGRARAAATSCGRRTGASSPGTSTVRRMNASRKTALARPMPNSAITRCPASRNEPKTQIMIVAAAVITRPVAAWPMRTECRLSRGVHPLLVHAADQEHLVVHRQAEQDREHHHRQERLDRPGARRPSGPARKPSWKTRVTTPNAAPAASRFITAAVERDQQAAERDHQQQAAEQRRSRR